MANERGVVVGEGLGAASGGGVECGAQGESDGAQGAAPWLGVGGAVVKGGDGGAEVDRGVAVGCSDGCWMAAGAAVEGGAVPRRGGKRRHGG